MRRTWLVPAALVGVLLVAPHAWAPPPFGGGRPAPPPPPRPPVPTPRPPSTPARPPVTSRPPVVLPRPDFHAQLAAARTRSAAEAAELLRRQSAATVSRAQRAAALNQLAHQMLRQKQAAALAELRALRADWLSVGTGAGLDPILAMELEAAESAAERALLADALKLAADGWFALAVVKVDSLASPRYLPAAVVVALPELRAELTRAVPARAMRDELGRKDPRLQDVTRHVEHVAEKALPSDVRRAIRAWGALLDASEVLAAPGPNGDRAGFTVERVEGVLKEAKGAVGDEVAGKLRAEVAAALFLDGRPKDATALLEDAADPFHAAAVLADLRAVVLGRGEVATPQVAALVRPGAPPAAAAVLPRDRLAGWKPPAHKGGETTVAVALADARKLFKDAIDAELNAVTAKINATADRIRAALAAEVAAVKPFLEKVEAARGKPFASPGERQLAWVAGTHRLTVAEAVGVLAAESDRPAAAARFLAVVPTPGDPGRFAAAVELSGRAPAAFAPHPDAGFKLTGVRDRARIRDAVVAVIDAHAARAAAGQPVDDFGREALEAAVARRLGLTADALRPIEFVQGVLDACRDWADDHARLAAAFRELNDAVSGIEAGRYGPLDDELKEILSAAKLRRLSVQYERKRREAGVGIGCQLLGGYGAEAKAAREWLLAQGEDKPWRAVALLNLARINEGE